LHESQQYAAEVEAVLRGDNYPDFFAQMYGNEPDRWQEDLTGWDRLRFITNCFTRLRYCDANGKVDMQSKGAPGSQPVAYQPWFDVAERKTKDEHVVFGHWSTLGLYQKNNVVSLDTGCLWGGQLTAMRLQNGKIQNVQCSAQQQPGTS